MTEDWDKIRKKALERAGYRCKKCGSDSQRLHVHHIKPRKDGGSDEMDNLKVLCPDCHADEHDAEACLLCGGIIHEGGQATVLDTSGGSLVHICDDCRDIIAATGEDGERCGICARIRNPSRACGIYWMDYGKQEPPHTKICDECRKVVVFGRRNKVERYIDRELPDAWVDFKHWEDTQP